MVKDKLLDFKTEKEYNDYMFRINSKFNSGEKLSKEEVDNFCFALPYNEKKKHSICDNNRFEYLYLHVLDNGSTRTKLSEEQYKDYNLLLTKWQSFLEKGSGIENKDAAIRTEYKNEVKSLQKDFKDKPDCEETKSQIKDKKSKIIGYNRYIYQKGLDIFPHYNFPITYRIDNIKIFLDEFILYHSLIRHYGEIIKQTSEEKSYFTEDVLVENIYDLLCEIFDLLLEKNVVISNPISIRILYKSKPYQLYTKKNGDKYRLNSFFPIEDHEKLKELNEEYKMLKLNDDLGYYEKK